MMRHAEAREATPPRGPTSVVAASPGRRPPVPDRRFCNPAPACGRVTIVRSHACFGFLAPPPVPPPMPVPAPNAFAYPVSYVPPPLSPIIGGVPAMSSPPVVDTNAVQGWADPAPAWFGWGQGGLTDQSWTGRPRGSMDVLAGQPPEAFPRPEETAHESQAPPAGRVAVTPGASGPAGGLTSAPAARQAETADERNAAMMAEGIEAFAAGRYEAAGSLFLQVSLADRTNVDSLLAYAVARFASGDYANSAMAVRHAVRMQPEVVNAPFDIRDRYGRMADFDRHLVALHVHIRRHAHSADAWLTLGFVRHFAGQRDLAREAFAALRELAGEDADVAEAFLAARPEASEP